MVLLKQKVLTKCSSNAFLPCDYVLNFTVKDSDKKQEEEKMIPDFDEEGNYYLCVYSDVPLVRHEFPPG